MGPLFFTDPYRDGHPEVVADFFARDGSLSARRRHYRASRSHDALKALGGITAPALIVHGGADRVTPVAQARLLAERIPAAQLLIEPHQLHCLHLESAQVRHRVEGFLTAPR